MQRKTLLLYVIFTFCCSLSLSSQSSKTIDLTLHERPIKEFFATIEEKLGYSFMYSNADIDERITITVNEKEADLKTLLQRVLDEFDISFEITSDKVVLSKKGKNASQTAEKRKRRQGVILDETGEPIIGASIRIKGTTLGTITDLDGRFELEADDDDLLVASFMGYESQEFKLGSQASFNIRMKEDMQLLDEVVVVGYGSMKKSDLTGAISSVNTKDLASRATTSPAEALQGVVAGVNVQKNSGIAGAGEVVKIRGVNTFGDNDPLYIIDGFPGAINSVNPNDIESMEILKDAAAAAIYGSVAANGVIIITTKNGKQGKIQVDINSYGRTTQTSNRLDVLDAKGYVNVHRSMYEEYNRHATQPVTLPGYISKPGPHDTNWQDAVFRTGYATTQSVAIRGGQSDTRYALSTNITQEKGFVISNALTQQNARMKISTRKNIFTVDGNMSYTGSKGSMPNFNLKEVYMLSPLVPVYDANEKGGFGLTNKEGIPHNVNVIAEDHFKSNATKKQEFAGNIAVGVDIAKGLTFKTSYSYRNVNSQYTFHHPAYTSREQEAHDYPIYKERRSFWSEQVFDNLLNYTHEANRHSFNALLGTSLTLEAFNWNDISVEGKNTSYSIDNGNIATSENPAGFLDPYFMTIGAGKGGTFNADGSKHRYHRMSYFGRLNYDYDKRYYAQVTFRRDGSSKFGRESRYGNFPSVALGWRIDQEAFFPEESAFSNLKLRASWGKLGNEVALGYYDYQALISSYNNLYMGYVKGDGNNPWPGSIATGIENRKLHWETTVSKNIGLDFGLFKNKLSGSINYYNNTTEDLLITKKLAPSAGVDDPILNVGEINNSGLEVELNYTDRVGGFNYQLGFNVSSLKNNVVALADDDQILFGNGLKYDTEHFPNQTRVGYPIGAFYLYKTDGIFQSAQEVQAHKNSQGELLQGSAQAGDLRFVDTNGDGVIDDEDKLYCGSGIPKLEVNFNLRASYKGFDASALIGSGWGHKLYNGNRYFYEGMNSGSNFLTSSLNAWTPENSQTTVPRAVLQDPNGNTRESDRFLESGDFIRLRQIQLGYTLPASLLTKIRVENLRLYISGENIFTWTKYSGIDPEFASSGENNKSSVLNTGVDRYIFPFTSSYVAGIQFTF